MKELRTILYGEPMFPDGFVMNHPITPSLEDIYALLANGRNVRVTLDKDDGQKVTYELVEVPE
jgi:hypothetical protein